MAEHGIMLCDPTSSPFCSQRCSQPHVKRTQAVEHAIAFHFHAGDRDTDACQPVSLADFQG